MTACCAAVVAEYLRHGGVESKWAALFCAACKARLVCADGEWVAA